MSPQTLLYVYAYFYVFVFYLLVSFKIAPWLLAFYDDPLYVKKLNNFDLSKVKSKFNS